MEDRELKHILCMILSIQDYNMQLIKNMYHLICHPDMLEEIDENCAILHEGVIDMVEYIERKEDEE